MNLVSTIAPWASSVSAGHPFAYLFERFPSFVQTFCYREAAAMVRLGMNPLILSIRPPEDSQAVAAEFHDPVQYLPEEKALRAEVDRWNAEGQLPAKVRKALKAHRGAPDSQRLFEAVWLAPVLQRAGIRHVHAHFGGMATRTAWWLRELFQITYSFTGHANDIFCESGSPVKNEQLARGAEFVVTETDYARHWMERQYPRLDGRVFRVFNGLDTRAFPEPATVSTAEAVAAYDILSVGRYVEKKGFAHLITACAQLRDAGRVFTCGIVGGGPLHESLARQIAELRLEGIVTLLGPHSQAEVQALLRSSKIFALACVPDSEGGSDNLPTVVMEAMLCGTPVVSTRLAGVPEMISHGVDGLMVPPGDPAALASALEQLLSAPEKARAMRLAAYRAARKKFSVDNSAAELAALLAQHAGVEPTAAARAKLPSLPAPPPKSLLAKLGALFR